VPRLTVHATTNPETNKVYGNDTKRRDSGCGGLQPSELFSAAF
jgi:hypothetical protein